MSQLYKPINPQIVIIFRTSLQKGILEYSELILTFSIILRFLFPGQFFLY